MPTLPAWLVVSSLCAIAWAAQDHLAAARVLTLILLLAPVIDWAERKRFGLRTSTRPLPSTAALSLFMPLQLALLIWALQGAASASAAELAQRVLLVGVANGIFGMTIAHELLHRPGRLARVTADTLLILALYGHFRITHLEVHHESVATSSDPATPVRGEGLYAFFGRSIACGLEIAIDRERKRLLEAGRSPFSPDNRVLRAALISLAVIASVWLMFGAAAAVLFIGQALAAVYTLEALNYVQHYGLSRRCGHDVAWDCGGTFTNWLMLDLGDHNRHHGPGRDRVSTSSRLPASYLLMIVVAAVPPLWRAIMDRRITPAMLGAEGIR